MEVFKKIVGFDNYEISNYGRVRSLGVSNTKYYKSRPRILKPDLQKTGYLQVTLYRDKKPYKLKIHRLVAMTFIKNPLCLEFVNHIDCSKTNNRSENLEWCTRNQNMSHAVKNGRMKGMKGELNPMSKLNKKQVLNIIKLREGGETLKKISEMFNTSFQNVSKIINGDRWTSEVPEFTKRELLTVK